MCQNKVCSAKALKIIQSKSLTRSELDLSDWEFIRVRKEKCQMLRTQWMRMYCKVPRIHLTIQYFDRSILGTQSIAVVQLLFH